VWKPSVIPLLRVKRHMAAISCDQEAKVWPSWTSGANLAWRKSKDGAQQFGDESGALLTGPMFFQQEIAESLFKAVDHLQPGMDLQVGLKFFQLLRLEVVTVPAHERQQSAILGTDRVQIAPAIEKVVIYQPDDVKAIGDDQGVGKELAHQRAIHCRQIHAHHAYESLPSKA